MKFKIGDRVVTLTNEGSIWDTGTEHTITQDYLDGCYELDNEECWLEYEIELVYRVEVCSDLEEHF